MNESDARFLEQLKKLYASAFDLTEEAASGEWMFRIYGHFNADHSGFGKYKRQFGKRILYKRKRK